ncbi:thiamine phosphate phosphatase-like protein isoform X2 [Malania oleifera]|uniref:thiamine phosphate phosphatase-like protein isoform X2 n=1 Tax=Malania oleifera TaxID=397392 RepID=UPI0025AE7184|nr:thiamine phosphate phosphatase-like protein isoform X2 [Malania oleifera]
MAAPTVVVFDFDRTIIDGDSDNWVVVEMGLTQLFHQLRPTMPWNSLMGKTVHEIADCLKRVPLHPRIIAAIKGAHAFGCDLRIVSDANQFFIETILEHHGLLGCFSEIITNPTFADEEGRLRIFPYHVLNSTPHGCRLCPSNLCKGLVIERIRASVSQNGGRRFIYLGDGNGDYCPTLKLIEGDHVMPRRNFPLWERIRSNPMLIKAEVHEWVDGEELEKVLGCLINCISAEENISSSDSNPLNPSDCKFQAMPDLPHEAVPQSLPVPH